MRKIDSAASRISDRDHRRSYVRHMFEHALRVVSDLAVTATGTVEEWLDRTSAEPAKLVVLCRSPTRFLPEVQRDLAALTNAKAVVPILVVADFGHDIDAISALLSHGGQGHVFLRRFPGRCDPNNASGWRQGNLRARSLLPERAWEPFDGRAEDSSGRSHVTARRAAVLEALPAREGQQDDC